MFDKIQIANDGSDGARHAFDIAIKLAAANSGRLHMVSVEEGLRRYAQTIGEVAEEREVEDAYFSQLASQAKRRAALQHVELDCSILAGHEVKTIVESIRQPDAQSVCQQKRDHANRSGEKRHLSYPDGIEQRNDQDRRDIVRNGRRRQEHL